DNGCISKIARVWFDAHPAPRPKVGFVWREGGRPRWTGWSGWWWCNTRGKRGDVRRRRRPPRQGEERGGRRGSPQALTGGVSAPRLLHDIQHDRECWNEAGTKKTSSP